MQEKTGARHVPAHRAGSGTRRAVTGMVFCAVQFTFATIASAEEPVADTAAGTGPVWFSLEHSNRMFDRQNHVTDKVAGALRFRQSGVLETNRFYFGGRFVGSVIAETTNTAGKFPILSRLPPSHASGTSDTYSVINEATIGATVTLPWVTGYVQGEFTEVAYTGQDDFQWRKYWVAIGDLDTAPVYLAVGKKTVNFGDFSTYAPFTHNHSAHYFWSQTKDPLLEIGYVSEMTEAAFSLIPNHRGLRVISSPPNDGAYENYALNLKQRFRFDNGLGLQIGAGYLRGTIYDSAIAHHPPGTGTNRVWNGAYDINATLSGANFDVMAEFTETDDIWPATGHKVQALSLQGRYRSELFGRPVTYSLAASRGVQGASGTQWEKMDQVILGAEFHLSDNAQFGIEYLYNEGFVPLIMPTVVADAGVVSHTLVVGARLSF